jgi:hypothetical protein
MSLLNGMRQPAQCRADEPAAIARGRGLEAARHRVVGDPARAAVADAAPVKRKVQILRRPIEATVTAAERVSRIDALHREFDVFPAGAAASKGSEPQIGSEGAIDAERAAIGDVGRGQHHAVSVLLALAAKATRPDGRVVIRRCGGRGLAEHTSRLSEDAGFCRQCSLWKRRGSANIIFGCTKGKWCLRTKLPHFGLSDSLNFVDNTRSCEALCSREHYEQNQDVSLFILRLREIHLIA